MSKKILVATYDICDGVNDVFVVSLAGDVGGKYAPKSYATQINNSYGHGNETPEEKIERYTRDYDLASEVLTRLEKDGWKETKMVGWDHWFEYFGG